MTEILPEVPAGQSDPTERGDRGGGPAVNQGRRAAGACSRPTGDGSRAEIDAGAHLDERVIAEIWAHQSLPRARSGTRCAPTP